MTLDKLRSIALKSDRCEFISTSNGEDTAGYWVDPGIIVELIDAARLQPLEQQAQAIIDKAWKALETDTKGSNLDYYLKPLIIKALEEASKK